MKAFIYSWKEVLPKSGKEIEGKMGIIAETREKADEIARKFSKWCPEIERFLADPPYAKKHYFRVEEVEMPTFH